jgi:hypothetical protein
MISLAEQVVGEDEGGHGFDDGDGAGQDAGVVAAFALEFGVFAGGGDGFLRGHDGGGGLEGDAEEDVFAVGNAALDAAGAVGGGADLAVLHAEGSLCSRPVSSVPETGADLEALGGGDGEHGLGEVGFQLVEDRLAEAGRAVADDALDDAADRVAVGADRLDALDHRLDHRGIGGADDVGFDVGGETVAGIDGGLRSWIGLTQARTSMPG